MRRKNIQFYMMDVWHLPPAYMAQSGQAARSKDPWVGPKKAPPLPCTHPREGRQTGFNMLN